MPAEIENPYQTPRSNVDRDTGELEYVGFWARVGAAVIDTILLLCITLPISYLLYGKEYFTGGKLLFGYGDFFLSYVFPAVAVLVFWKYKSATPGKMAIGAVIVDDRSGGAPTTGQLIGRYFAYIPAMLVFLLGIFWVGWDPKKQGWHDKLAGTVVIRSRPASE